MSENVYAFAFNLKQQEEIVRISIDEDKDAALELIKKIYEEMRKREQAHCKVMFDFVPSKKKDI